MASVAKMLQSNKSGIVQTLSIPAFTDTIIQMFVEEGAEVRQFTNSNDAIGQIIVKAENLKKCKDVMESALREISIVLEWL